MRLQVHKRIKKKRPKSARASAELNIELYVTKINYDHTKNNIKPKDNPKKKLKNKSSKR